MATLESLDIQALSDMSDEELLNHIRAIRGRRRTPDPIVREKAKKVAIAKKSKAAEHLSVAELTKGLSEAQQKELFATLLAKEL